MSQQQPPGGNGASSGVHLLSMHQNMFVSTANRFDSKGKPLEKQPMRILTSRTDLQKQAAKDAQLALKKVSARERFVTRQQSVSQLELLVKPKINDKLTTLSGPKYPLYPFTLKDELSSMVADSVTNHEDSIATLERLGGVQGIAKLLCLDLKEGLMEGSVHCDKLASSFGINKLPGARDADFVGLVVDALNDTMLLMLILAAIVSLVLGLVPATSEDPATGWIEGTAILIAVSIVTLITAVNDYKKALQFKALTELTTSNLVSVTRNGKEKEISAFDVQMGDIVSIDVGNKIPADGLYIAGDDITCDESGSTGENEPCRKGDYQANAKMSPFFLSGTSVLSGYGKFLVVSVGVNSFDGKLRMAVRAGAGEGEEGDNETPLQQKLDKLANLIGKIGMVLATLTCIALFIVLVLRANEHDEMGKLPSRLVNVFILCVTIVVVAVPEGLPLAVTIALAFALTKMVKKNNLVREMDACEVMGGVTTICSDKTGTLTQNKMTVSMGTLAGVKFDFIKDANGKNVTKDMDVLAKELASAMNKSVLALCNTMSALNTTCYESVNVDHVEGDDLPEFVTQGGNPTEHALVRFAADSQGMNYEERRKDFQDPLLRIAFSSARKMMSTIATGISDTEEKNDLVDLKGSSHIFTKGAAEMVMTKCVSKVDSTGQIVDLTDQDKTELTEYIAVLSENSLRPIAMAYRPVTVDEVTALQNQLSGGAEVKQGDAAVQYPMESKLIWLGLVGIRDPLRKEVPGAVEECQKAGIRIIMVTGDNLGTAKAIAKDCNIYHDGVGIAMLGKDFRVLSEEAMAAVIPKLCVLARSSPQDKQILVKAIQKTNEIVAVTGDGTNDGPALAMADVGFSMGAGTEVAKEASKIILLDNNFASVTTAVLWGRSVYDSIRCFLQFQLTVNVVAMTLAIVGAFSDEEGESPLSAVMLLWVNLIMDTFAALALATQPPTPDLMTYAPIVKDAPLINKRMWVFIGVQGMFQLVVNFVTLYWGHTLFKHVEYFDDQHKTLVFNVFVFCQIFNEVNARKVHRGQFNVFEGFFANAWFPSVFVGSCALQVAMVQLFGRFAGTAPLTAEMWLYCLSLSILTIPLGLVVTAIGLLIPEEMAVNALERLKGPADVVLTPAPVVEKKASKLTVEIATDNAADPVSPVGGQTDLTAEEKKLQLMSVGHTPLTGFQTLEVESGVTPQPSVLSASDVNMHYETAMDAAPVASPSKSTIRRNQVAPVGNNDNDDASDTLTIHEEQ